MKEKIIAIFLLFFLFLIPHFFSSPVESTPIKHVIIIIEENHSFDNMFGTYPFGWPPIVNNVTKSVMEPQGLYSNVSQLISSKDGTLGWISVPDIPWLPISYSHPYYADAYDTVDPYEGWNAYHGDYWFDKPEGFVYYSGPQSMAYFSYQQNWIFWDYAEVYTLADDYFAPVLGLTEPNRVTYMTGIPPNFYSDDVCNAIPFNQTIMYQLQMHNVSWDYFTYNLNGIPWPMGVFIGIKSYVNHLQGLSSFYNDLKTGKLPSVSWVMFINGQTDKYDMHPPYNVTEGEVAINKVINAVMESRYWNSTAIFITFDEGGGYYDQVIPPSINHYGLGQRIPLLIISPYAKEAYIDNYTISGYTLLAFIDYNWHLPWLTSWVGNSNIQGLLNAFNFTTSPRPPLILVSGNWSYPIKLQYPVHYGYIAKVEESAGYAVVYSQPALQFLLPIELLGFVLLILSTKKRILLPISLILLLSTTAIAGYINSFYNVYSFVIEYYLYSSVIGLLAGFGLLAKRLKKRG
ncbi:alkaline phosphatase family protein [Acidianus sp. DSM 29099]|nr:alkaline phosphatase family protein [Acidianus sp. RZ1]NON61536.1 alkaline phosphatase family protein [Acidianus sp. RZ1]